MVFFAEFFLCLNWAPVAAMLLVSEALSSTNILFLVTVFGYCVTIIDPVKS